MQTERWRQIEELYQAALAPSQEKRAAFLAQTCADDPDLRGKCGRCWISRPIRSWKARHCRQSGR
jgi:hypothetical protein